MMRCSTAGETSMIPLKLYQVEDTRDAFAKVTLHCMQHHRVYSFTVPEYQ